jgi:ABC-type Na+ efflux pump permease subunit
MVTFNGLPAHVLFVHAIVILAPLTAVLAILCAVWPAARQRLVWLVLALAVITTVTTPLTTNAGAWLADRLGPSPVVDAHAELGSTMIYFALGLLVAAVLLAVVQVRHSRGRTANTVVTVVVAAVVVVAGVATTVQVYRIGDSGARAAWGNLVANDAH